MKTLSGHYVGVAGHLAVMSEFAWRRYNVAIPEIDVGDDIFVMNDDTGGLWRVQVKTASGTRQKNSIRYLFSASLTAINNTEQSLDIHFIFAMRDSAQRWRFARITRSELATYVRVNKIGTRNQRYGRSLDLVLVFTLHDDGRLTAGGNLDLTYHLDNCSSWPPILERRGWRPKKSTQEEPPQSES